MSKHTKKNERSVPKACWWRSRRTEDDERNSRTVNSRLCHKSRVRSRGPAGADSCSPRCRRHLPKGRLRGLPDAESSHQPGSELKLSFPFFTIPHFSFSAVPFLPHHVKGHVAGIPHLISATPNSPHIILAEGWYAICKYPATSSFRVVLC